MKKLATIAFIIASTITTIANAETIKPKKEVIFDMGVCIDVEVMDNCMSQHIQILTTGIEWLDKELLLNSGLILDNKGKYLQSSNKSFDELKIQLKQQYEKNLIILVFMIVLMIKKSNNLKSFLQVKQQKVNNTLVDLKLNLSNKMVIPLFL